jgi:hypothetical protein
MNCLPQHGRVNCTLCFEGKPVIFDETQRTEAGWRITANPLAWGSSAPEIVVLGFSKGPTQAGALTSTPHDKIVYKGSRGSVGKMLAHVGLLTEAPSDLYVNAVDQLISDRSGRFHFGSRVRCMVERFDKKAEV